MLVYDVVEWVPFLFIAPFVLVPAGVALYRRYGLFGRTWRLGYRHFCEDRDIHDEFTSSELAQAYQRGWRCARQDVNQIEESRKQRQDKKLLSR